MTRDPSWPTMLASFIEARRRVPFAWGVNDCCLFGADWVRLCTGVDLASDLRGHYSTALGAARILRQHGGVDGVVRRTGLAEIQPRLASRGDIAVADLGTGGCVGLVLGPCAAFVGRDGLLFAPFTSGRCWKL